MLRNRKRKYYFLEFVTIFLWDKYFLVIEFSEEKKNRKKMKKDFKTATSNLFQSTLGFVPLPDHDLF